VGCGAGGAAPCCLTAALVALAHKRTGALGDVVGADSVNLQLLPGGIAEPQISAEGVRSHQTTRFGCGVQYLDRVSLLHRLPSKAAATFHQ
jgi:hypothetical protein